MRCASHSYGVPGMAPAESKERSPAPAACACRSDEDVLAHGDGSSPHALFRRLADLSGVQREMQDEYIRTAQEILAENASLRRSLAERGAGSHGEGDHQICSSAAELSTVCSNDAGAFSTVASPEPVFLDQGGGTTGQRPCSEDGSVASTPLFCPHRASSGVATLAAEALPTSSPGLSALGGLWRSDAAVGGELALAYADYCERESRRQPVLATAQLHAALPMEDAEEVVQTHQAAPQPHKSLRSRTITMMMSQNGGWGVSRNMRESTEAKAQEAVVEERAREKVKGYLFPEGGSFEDIVTPQRLNRTLVELGWTSHTVQDALTLLEEMTVARHRIIHAELTGEDARISRNVVILDKTHSKAVKKPKEGQTRSAVFSRSNSTRSLSSVENNWAEMTCEEFMKNLFSCDLKPVMSEEAWLGLQASKKVLTSTVATKLVSCATKLSMSDLLAPPSKPTVVEKMEPFVACLILINGVLLGVQNDEGLEMWPGWFWMEQFFVAVFLVELAARACLLGLVDFFTGSDYGWNLLDLIIVVTSIFETAIQAGWSTNVLRLARLTRLSRLVRMLRFRIFKDLTVMLKGFMGGLRTLAWSMVMLLSAIYVIALFMSSTIGSNASIKERFDEEANLLFSSVPRCMFVAFLCFTGDCTDSKGISIVTSLFHELGIGFALPYVTSVMLINFGIFNIIIAVYMEAILAANKDSMSPEQERSKAMEQAHCLTTLIKRMSTLHSFQTQQNDDEEETTPMRSSALLRSCNAHDLDDCDEDFSIDKDAFVFMLQDPVVSSCLDEMNVQSFNRSHLFDVLDLDGSGCLQISELLQGLLLTQGDSARSDTVACLLSIRQVKESHMELIEDLSNEVQQVADCAQRMEARLDEVCMSMNSLERDWNAVANERPAAAVCSRAADPCFSSRKCDVHETVEC